MSAALSSSSPRWEANGARAFVVAMALAGCEPAPKAHVVPEPAAPTTTAPSPGNAAPTVPPPARSDGLPPAPRTILERSAWGDVSPGNYLMNGDFELGIGAVAPGWYAVADGHVMPFRYRSGGACRSGLLCAEIAAGQALVATMVALPPSGVVRITAFAKPRSGRCTDVRMTLVTETFGAPHAPGLELRSAQGSSDEASQSVDQSDDGWCRHVGVLTVDRALDRVSLAIEARDNTLLDEVSVRSAVLTPADGGFPTLERRTVSASVLAITRLAQDESRRARGAPTPPPRLPNASRSSPDSQGDRR